MSKDVEQKSEAEIDEIVVSQAGDELAWEEPVRVRAASSNPVLRRRLENPMHEYALREIRKQREAFRDLGIDARQLTQLAEQQRLINSLGLDYWKTDLARIAAESIASLQNVAHSPFYDAARDANLSLVHLMNEFQAPEQELATQLSQLTHAWHKELNWVRDMEKLAIGKAINEHLAQITQISVLAQSALSHLGRDQVGYIFKISLEEQSALSASIANLSSSYKNLFASFELDALSVLSVSPELSRLPAVEFFNEADLIRLTSSTLPLQAQEDEERLIVREEISRETSDSLEALLVTVNPDLTNLLNGAQHALLSDNSDKVRHFTTSYRELFTHVLHGLAPDQEVRAWTSDPEHYSNARPTRKARLLYISRRVSNPAFNPFLEKDIEAVLAALQLFHKGTHEVVTAYSIEQLKALQIRIEAALRFMLEVSKAGYEATE